MKLSIIVPVYNEERTVSTILQKVLEVKLPKGVTKEIVVVNDGSKDKTSKILNSFKNPLITVINHPQNKGKGAAVRTGFAAAKGDYLIIQDADLEYNPDDYVRLLEPVMKYKAKVVYGTRLKDYPLILWGKDRTPIPTHWLGNKFLTKLTNFLYGSNLTDMETCYKLMKKDFITSLNLRSDRFEIEPEITSKILKKGVKIVEIPIKVIPRGVSEGKKISWKDGFGAVYTLLRYRFFN